MLHGHGRRCKYLIITAILRAWQGGRTGAWPIQYLKAWQTNAWMLFITLIYALAPTIKMMSPDEKATHVRAFLVPCGRTVTVRRWKKINTSPMWRAGCQKTNKICINNQSIQFRLWLIYHKPRPKAKSIANILVRPIHIKNVSISSLGNKEWLTYHTVR